MSDYNWTEIIKNKEDHEVYSISLGKTHRPKIVINIAKEELKSRGINETNIDKYRQKWRLEENLNLEYGWGLFDLRYFLSYIFSSILLFIIAIIETLNFDNITLLLFCYIFSIISAYAAFKIFKDLKKRKQKAKEEKSKIQLEDL